MNLKLRRSLKTSKFPMFQLYSLLVGNQSVIVVRQSTICNLRRSRVRQDHSLPEDHRRAGGLGARLHDGRHTADHQVLGVPEDERAADQAGHRHAHVRHELQPWSRGVCGLRFSVQLTTEVWICYLRISNLHEGHLRVPGPGRQSGRSDPHQLASLHSREVITKIKCI